MKLAKMSMVAALLLGANAYAIDNVKVNGNAKLFYMTSDYDDGTAGTNANGSEDGFFDKRASKGDVALNLGLTADLTENVSAGVSMTAVSTLGLENNLVSGTWSSAHATTTNGTSSIGANVDDAMWVDEAWIAGTAFDTTAKVGRQALDTPLAFTETWGVDKNTFEAAVLINNSIEDTTIIAAWVGKSNGLYDDVNSSTTNNSHGLATAGYMATGGKFSTFAKDGAYAFGLVNNSFKPVTAQAWYYDLPSLATAYWLQADLNMEGILAGAQYANVDVTEATRVALGTTDTSTSVYALMLGYEMKDVATIKVAYSSVDDTGSLSFANVATNVAGTNNGMSKLYTEAYWNYGPVSTIGSDTINVTVSGKAAGLDLMALYCNADVDVAGGTANDYEMNEIALTVGRSFGPLDATAALIFEDYDFVPAATADTEATRLQVYLTYNF